MKQERQAVKPHGNNSRTSSFRGGVSNVGKLTAASKLESKPSAPESLPWLLISVVLGVFFLSDVHTSMVGGLAGWGLYELIKAMKA